MENGSGSTGVVVRFAVLFRGGGRKSPVKLVAPNVELMLEELQEESLTKVGCCTPVESSSGLKSVGKSWLQLGSEAWWRLTSWLMRVDCGSSKLPVVADSVVLALLLLGSLLMVTFTAVLFTSMS